jgi:hypothetical protein
MPHGCLTPRVFDLLTNSSCLPYLSYRKSTMSNRYYMPDTLESWKWPRRLNPHYIEAKAASEAWLRRFGAFSSRAQYAFDRCDLGTS